MYEVLAANLIRSGAEISICSYYIVKGSRAKPYYPKLETRVMSASEGLAECLLAKRTGVTAVNKLYQKDIFRTLRFPVGRTMEDSYIVVDIFEQASRVALTTKPLYYYFHRADSISNVKYDKCDLALIGSYRRVRRQIGSKFPELEDLAMARLLWAYLRVLDKSVLDDGEKELNKKIQRYVRGHLGNLRCGLFTRNRKIMALTACVSLPIYRLLIMVAG